jgi:hypothetical protein
MGDERQVEDSPQSRQGRKGKGKDLKSVRYDIIQQTLASFLILFAVKKSLPFPWCSWRLGVSNPAFPSAFIHVHLRFIPFPTNSHHLRGARLVFFTAKTPRAQRKRQRFGIC